MKRHFESDAERTIHAITLNLARRQLGPITWGKAYKVLLEARGVKTGQGQRNDKATSVKVTEVAREAGVSLSTAEKRLKLAKDLEPYPDTAEKVDRGDVPASRWADEAAEEARRKGIDPPLAVKDVLSSKNVRHTCQADEDRFSRCRLYVTPCTLGSRL